MKDVLRIRVASAGTGKTTVLVARYLELIGSGVPLRRIAGATFTRASAEELRQRVAEGITTLLNTGSWLDLVELTPGSRAAFEEARRELPGSLLTTISGLMARFLRLTAVQASLDPEFSLMDEHDARAIFEEEFRSLLLTRGEDPDGTSLELALMLFERRSLAEEFRAGDSSTERLLSDFSSALQAYRRRLAASLLGPADVEREALRVVANPAALRRIASRYGYVLVDEFQDVNPLQGSFFAALSAAGLRVEAVGDPKQSIYGFRDADVGVFRAALAEGERLPDLTHTRRHSPAVTGFLNAATDFMARHSLGFTAEEAPQVSVAGPQAQKQGAVGLHLVTGNASIAVLRNQEARLLVRLLQEEHARGTAWDAMAVLARSHASLDLAHRALLAEGIPAALGSGRGFFQRPEIRDVANALRTAVSPSGPAFAAFLRSPFGQLSLDETQQVLLASDRYAALDEADPQLAAAVRRLQELVLLPPLEALKSLLREKLARGRRFADWLGQRQRANLDALLLRAARQPPADLELLLSEIERHARSQVAEVPESGGGVSLVTVHYSKGLEWPVTAIFDAGRDRLDRAPGLLVRSGDGSVALPGSRLYAELNEDRRERELQESYRQFYVAASRPRDRLIITGSVPAGRPARGWAELLSQLAAEGALPHGLELQKHPFDSTLAGPLPERRREAPVRVAAPWSSQSFPAGRFRPVMSPSLLRATDEESAEPLIQGELLGDDTHVTPAAATGTLLHAAVAWDWDTSDPGFQANLLAQEVMFPFSDAERMNIVVEVSKLLDSYRHMLGTALPRLEDRDQDEAELPVVLPLAGTVWQGTIDRLYLAGGEWWLDDYKTDRNPDPDRYVSQLAVYFEAARAALSATPRVRLVWLRNRTVSELAPEVLQAALERLEDTSG